MHCARNTVCMFNVTLADCVSPDGYAWVSLNGRGTKLRETMVKQRWARVWFDAGGHLQNFYDGGQNNFTPGGQINFCMMRGQFKKSAMGYPSPSPSAHKELDKSHIFLLSLFGKLNDSIS